MKEQSPFTPGRVVPVEYFKGRKTEIKRLVRAARQVGAGTNQNIFLTGERGIGKSSLAAFLTYLCENENQLLPEDFRLLSTHCFLGPQESLPEVCQSVLTRLIQASRDKSTAEKIVSFLQRYVKKVDFNLFGVGLDIEFTKDDKVLSQLPNEFLTILRRVWDVVREEGAKGILIALDDLDGAASLPRFGSFIKSTVDELAVSREAFPLLLLLVGVEERRQELIQDQPSVARIFDVIELSLMSLKESEEFLRSALGSVGVSYQSDAIRQMARWAGGFPALLHEVGDAVFWADTDSHIDDKDLRTGLVVAADNVGRKYIDRRVYHECHSEAYRAIMRRLADMAEGPTTIRRADVLKELPESEARKFDNFVNRMINLGMLTRVHGRRGEYAFTNQLFRLYIWMEVQREERQVH